MRKALARSPETKRVSLTPRSSPRTPVRDAPSPGSKHLAAPFTRTASQRLVGSPFDEHAMRCHRLRALVTRSAGGPPVPFDTHGSTNQRCVRPTSAHTLESISGTLIRSATASPRLPLRAFGGPVRTTLHGIVARFGDSRSASENRALSSRRARSLAPPLTLLSLHDCHAFDE